MDGICEQCFEYISESGHCLCTHAIHSGPEISCPWCGLDDGERIEVLEGLDLSGEWEVIWLGHNYGGHQRGCGPVYGLTSVERSFCHCFGCHRDFPFERQA